MGTITIDTIWVLALFPKCTHHSHFTTAFSLFVLATLWLAMSLLYWAHPGGPAWGKYRLTRVSHWAKKPIPGPKGCPIIGSIGLMMGLAHRKLAAAAERSGGGKRLMAFSMGDTRAIVTCHPAVAKEILKSPDFADRPVKESAYRLMFNRAMGFAPYGTYWRTLRRIASTHMFSPKQIRASEAQRQVIVSEMVEILGSGRGRVKVREVLRRASLSSMMGSVFGRRYSLKNESNSGEVVELKEMVDQGYELLGILNWADHLSWVNQFDLQRIRFRCSRLVPKVNRFVARVIAQHRANPVHDQSPSDFVYVLLSLQGSDKFSDSDIIAVLWEMIFRGTDTVAVLIEWVLARLVLHPEVQARVHDELDKVVGRARAVTESDLSSLVYLTAVIKEVLRLHPPGPLLSWARLATQHTTVDSHHVPAGTTAMVNMWAIARDPEFWPHPDQFNPDRFLASEPNHMEFSVLGSDLRLAPFGSGRRACPGKALGLATVTFWVASLLHEFKWMESSDNMVDLLEVLKLSCEMAHPLTVEVQYRR